MKSGRWFPMLALAAATLAALAAVAVAGTAQAHGSVTPEEDLCVIRVGYYSAHFKIYQPRTRGHDQFCEDLPATGESVFVMEYEHSGLGDAPVDFRIMRNATGQGRFTRLNHIQALPDLDAHTVYYQPAAIQPDVFTALHDFEERGEFVGIVSVTEPTTGVVYTAVFPFAVGFTGFGYWPLFALALVLLQLNYLWMSGWFAAGGWRRLLPRRFLTVLMAPGLVVFCMALLSLSPVISVASESEPGQAEPLAAAWWISESGRYRLRAVPELRPLSINRMHSWTLEVQKVSGEPVPEANISVSGGMPAHDHGLATQPRVTRDLGYGRYLLEGMRFHMHGAWQLRFRITIGEVDDEVVISFDL